MTAPAFNPRDPETWELLLSLDQVAAIYHRTPEAIRHSLKPSARSARIVPKPVHRHPAQWRAADVIRDLQATQFHSLRKVVA